MPKITLNPFDRDSIDRAIEQVKAYRDSLTEKEKKIREAVAQQLTDAVKVGFNGAADEDIIVGNATAEKVEVDVIPDHDGESGVKADGKKAVFQEFGAGVYYNGSVGSSPNPLGPQNMFYIGTFGQGKGARKVWGFYDPPDARDLQHLVLTHGTPASMPMYHAEQEIIEKIPEIAREVFKDGDAT